MNNFQVYFHTIFVFGSTLGLNVMTDNCCVFPFPSLELTKGTDSPLAGTTFPSAGTRWRRVAGS